MKHLSLALIFSALVTPQAFANDVKDISNPHTIFIGIGHGDVEFQYTLDGMSKKDDRTSEVEFSGYRYQFNETWAIDARYMRGKPGFFTGLFHSSSKVSFHSRILSVQGLIPLSKRWSLYGNLGVNNYDWDIVTSSDNGQIERQALQKENGTGLFAAAGVKVAWERVELTFDYQILKMGDLDTDVFTLAAGFKF
ncbi:MAG: hypothetical protein BM565_08200 [Gammaproteobacteria bacterium MedPE]|nr:MAG: hypothetical protein BM565_08200 [Gammaproteobacteria bacterium MedPE]